MSLLLFILYSLWGARIFFQFDYLSRIKIDSCIIKSVSWNDKILKIQL